MIDRDAWRIVEIIIRRYPSSKQEYKEYIDQVMASSSNPATGVSLSEDYSKPQSVTEAKAFKMTSKRAERLKKEIEAVELVYRNLNAEEQKVMKTRFWAGQFKTEHPEDACASSENGGSSVLSSISI